MISKVFITTPPKLYNVMTSVLKDMNYSQMRAPS